MYNSFLPSDDQGLDERGISDCKDDHTVNEFHKSVHSGTRRGTHGRLSWPRGYNVVKWHPPRNNETNVNSSLWNENE